MHIYVQTRNWNQSAEAKAILDQTATLGVKIYRSASNDNDDKYVLVTRNRRRAMKVFKLFKKVQPISGGMVHFGQAGPLSLKMAMTVPR